jgi:serine protease Do
MKSPAVRASVLLSCILAGVGLCAGAQPPDSDARVTPVVLAYRRARPAVVNISTTRLVRTRFSLFGGSDPFGDMLPDPFGREMSVRSLGSGIVINPMGYIVTNAHVVRQAEEISVTFADDTRHEARVISSDPDMDLAVLKIDPPSGAEIHYLPLGRSDDLMVGETVIAIGNPLGLANTLTTGVLSATDRDLKLSDDASISGLVQTDAPINPGNSGGPLLNIKGELIGINVAIRSDAQNIGFAIPVDKLAAEMVGLLDSERLNRTVLGVDVRPVHGGAGDEVVVTSVRKGTPADGKIDVGDVIVSLDGLPTPQISDYACAMVAAKAGQTLKIGLDRAGARREVSVELAAKPKPDGKELAREHFGIVLREITPDLARDLRTRVKGLLVVEVEANGPAGQAGIEPGDVVFQVGRLHVTDVDTLGMVMEDIKPGQKMMIGIVRGNVSVSGYLTSRKKP